MNQAKNYKFISLWKPTVATREITSFLICRLGFKSGKSPCISVQWGWDKIVLYLKLLSLKYLKLQAFYGVRFHLMLSAKLKDENNGFFARKMPGYLSLFLSLFSCERTLWIRWQKTEIAQHLPSHHHTCLQIFMRKVQFVFKREGCTLAIISYLLPSWCFELHVRSGTKTSFLQRENCKLWTKIRIATKFHITRALHERLDTISKTSIKTYITVGGHCFSNINMSGNKV